MSKTWAEVSREMQSNGVPIATMGYCMITFEAGQSASAARISELEKQLEKCKRRFNGAIETGVIRIADEQERIDELEADCKAMAEGLIAEPHKRLFGICVCPACIIAAKYREGL